MPDLVSGDFGLSLFEEVSGVFSDDVPVEGSLAGVLLSASGFDSGTLTFTVGGVTITVGGCDVGAGTVVSVVLSVRMNVFEPATTTG